MPWSTTSAMIQRLFFIRDFELGVFSFVALCARYGVSRETGYAVLARYRREGRAGDLPDAPGRRQSRGNGVHMAPD